MLIEPSEFEFDRVLQAIKDKGEDDFDMEIVNKLYQDNAMILPHRPYNLLTGEFRAEDHSHYLGNELEEWHPDAALSEAKLLHFSDWPIPKPWISTPEHLREEKPPKCQLHQTTGVENCRSRDIWLGLYSDFRERRQVRVVRILSYRRPELTLVADHLRPLTATSSRPAPEETSDETC